MTMMQRLRACSALAFLLGAGIGAAHADPMTDAKAFLAKYAGHVTAWDGPTTGPKAEKGKTIVVLAGDMKNGGILGVTNGFFGSRQGHRLECPGDRRRGHRVRPHLGL